MGFLSFYYYLILKGETCLTTFPTWLKNKPEMCCEPNYAPVPKTLRLILKFSRFWGMSFRFVWGHEGEVLMMGECFSAKGHQVVALPASSPLLFHLLSSPFSVTWRHSGRGKSNTNQANSTQQKLTMFILWSWTWSPQKFEKTCVWYLRNVFYDIFMAIWTESLKLKCKNMPHHSAPWKAGSRETGCS